MAVIGKIQKNSILLLIVIGGAMLAFIFTDFMTSSGRGDTERLPIATVYGEEIDEDEYNELRDIYVNREKETMRQQNNGAPLSDSQRTQAEQSGEDQAFNEVIRRNLMNREFDKIGLTCTSRELNDMLHGEHIHPWVQQIPIFRGPDGQFSRDSVRNFINNLDPDNEPDDETARANWLEARSQWKAFEDELKDTRTADKYVTLITKGLFINSIEAKEAYRAKNEIRSIRFVIQKYSDIPPDEIEVTDEEIKAYYEEHKTEKQYEMKESREVDYITFPIKATREDMAEIETELIDLKEKFKTTENNISFMNTHSDIEMLSDSVEFSRGEENFSKPQFMGPAQYPAVADEAIQSAQVGDVIGPFATVMAPEGDNIVFIAKVTGTRTEKQAWVRHILIKTDASRSVPVAKAMADSVIAVIQEKDNFVEMVQEVSEDPGSLASNGEYKWFAEGRMVPEFNDASFNGEIGKLQLVKTTYGYHIVEVLGRAERVVPKLAVVAKIVEPSENTMKYMEEQVFDFIFNVNESDNDSAFYHMAADSNLAVMNSRIWINQNYITGINKPKKVMKFAFGRNAMEGDISDPILDGDKYVVAYLTNVIEEGVPEFEDVKDQMRFPALKEKQAKIYMEKMAGKSSLEEVVQVVHKGQILTADVSFGANVIAGGGGNEPEIVGSLYRDELEVGFMTVPLKGRTGVYVCILDGITKAPETSDYSLQKTSLTQARRGSADNLVIRALREAADVQDNRRKIEYR
ncbi:MAG: peptidylprolyl isomerase [Crocinitomicaceae bacterium]|nr:peptidylprolyl isomerase [Crocinitomicaceae bacterium]